MGMESNTCPDERQVEKLSQRIETLENEYIHESIVRLFLLKSGVSTTTTDELVTAMRQYETTPGGEKNV